MTVTLIPLRPVALALIIGLFDLLLAEALKFSTKTASSWRRRTLLFRNDNYGFSKPSFFLSRVFIAQLILLALCIWLELSISPVVFPSDELVDDRCFKTERITRIIQKKGPSQGELEDDRIGPYIDETRCTNRLLKQALAGQTALTRGYPSCEKDFEVRNISETLLLQGSSVAHVASSGNGDPNLAYGLMAQNGSIIDEDHGYPNAPSLASTSFWGFYFASMNDSISFWRFEGPSTRIISNVQAPRDIISSAPNSTQFGNQSRAVVECEKNNLECYHRYADVANRLKPLNNSIVENRAAILIRTHRSAGGNVPSYICILDKGPIILNASWVYMTQNIPKVERNRTGQTITQLTITGDNAKCAWNVSRLTARLYFDAMEKINLNKALEVQNETTLTLFDRLRLVLVKSSVLTGMKTLLQADESNGCRVHNVQNGSSIGNLELIVSGVYVGILCIIILWDAFEVFHRRIECPMFVDPLDTRELLEQLRMSQSDINPRGNNTAHDQSIPVNVGEDDHDEEETDRREHVQTINRFGRIKRRITSFLRSNGTTDEAQRNNRTNEAVTRNAQTNETFQLKLHKNLHTYRLEVMRG